MTKDVFAKPESGDVVDGRFVLDSPLGQGSFASVWSARDRTAGERRVAIKLLYGRHASEEKKLKRFIQEAQILERLQHPNIAQPIAWSAELGRAYLALELIDGETLEAKLQWHSESGSQLPIEGVAWICDQLASAVRVAHEQAIVHRDLKPRNVMISRRGQRPFLKVLDFGIAKVLLGSDLDPTTFGKVLGSALYVSPEQVLSRPVDHRADVFSLGCICWEVATLTRAWARDGLGKPLPFHRPVQEGGELNTHIAVLRRIAKDPRPKVSEVRPGLSPALDDVLARAMAIDADDRFATAADLASALRVALVSRTGLLLSSAGLEDDEDSTLRDSSKAASDPSNHPTVLPDPSSQPTVLPDRHRPRPRWTPGSIAGPPPAERGPEPDPAERGGDPETEPPGLPSWAPRPPQSTASPAPPSAATGGASAPAQDAGEGPTKGSAPASDPATAPPGSAEGSPERHSRRPSSSLLGALFLLAALAIAGAASLLLDR